MKTFPADLCILTPRTYLGGTGDPDALENVIPDQLPDGALCWVLNAEDHWFLDKFSMSPVNSPECIATARGAAEPGRWKRALGSILVQGAGIVTPVAVHDMFVSPGITATASGVRFYYGDQSAADVLLNADPSAPVLPVVFAGLGANKKFSCSFAFRCTVWQQGTQANSGSIDCVVDLYITTDGAGVATAALQTTPFPDVSRLPTAIAAATATVAPSVGGVTISAQRPTGVACLVSTMWWVTQFKDIT